MKEPEKKGTFVNRHGHRASVNSVDLSDLSIDEQQTSEEVSTPAIVKAEKVQPSRSAKAEKPNFKRQPKKQLTKQKEAVTPDLVPMPKKEPRRPAFKWTRRRVIFLSVLLIALIATPLIIGEGLRARYVHSADSARNSYKSFVKSHVLPQQKAVSLSSKQLLETITKLESVRDDMCPGALWDNVSTLYPRAFDAHAACVNERGNYAAVATQLRALQNQLIYAESIDTALTQVTTPTADAFAVISSQQENWKKAHDSVTRLTPPPDFKSAHTKLATAVGKVSEGWSKLNIANNAQNASDFTAAETQLTEGYDNVRSVREEYASRVLEQQARVTALTKFLP